MSKVCENRAAIVTGAGSGLGRAYAMALAADGAGVVVNDINGEAANSVVSEIETAGGKAVADTHDITNWDDAGNIVKASIDAFGDIHAVVNNAGIVRDRMFTSMSEQEWDDVIRVHLKGHFCVTSHAARYWRARYGVTANTLAPQARTGMTEKLFADMMKKPDAGFDMFDPANVSPLVVWLASAHSGDVTGRCFEIFGGKLSVADGWRTGPEVEIGDAVRGIIEQAVPPQKIYGT